MKINLDAEDWGRIQKAASESCWMPPEYMRNEWVSDVCMFLRYGPGLQKSAELQWISCKDRMPEADTEVLVQYKPVWPEKTTVLGATRCKAFEDMDHLFWFNGRGESMRGEVTHWMPMPPTGTEHPQVQKEGA